VISAGTGVAQRFVFYVAVGDDPTAFMSASGAQQCSLCARRRRCSPARASDRSKPNDPILQTFEFVSASIESLSICGEAT
jgi:hypothetical protein